MKGGGLKGERKMKNEKQKYLKVLRRKIKKLRKKVNEVRKGEFQMTLSLRTSRGGQLNRGLERIRGEARGKETGVVKEDWKIACIIPVYKGRVARGECANYRVYLFS